MTNRRELLKNITFSGLFLALAGPSYLLKEVNALIEIPKRQKEKSDRTIFCIIDNHELEHSLKELARELNLDIIFDYPQSPELIFDHHFVSIVDGRTIEEGAWNLYVDFCNEGDINVPCLMFGDIGHLEMPQTGNVYHFDLDTDNGYTAILDAVRDIKTGIGKIHPA